MLNLLHPYDQLFAREKKEKENSPVKLKILGTFHFLFDQVYGWKKFVLLHAIKEIMLNKVLFMNVGGCIEK